MNKDELKAKLMSLKDKGYIKVAFVKEEGLLDVLLIHKSWINYNFFIQFDQANSDLKQILGNVPFSLEIPTLKMYQTERLSSAPDHDVVVFDLIKEEMI